MSGATSGWASRERCRVTMHVTVIAKAPVAGRVKTRLCPPCTPHEAAALATAALADTIDAIDAIDVAVPFRRVLLLDGAPQAWMPPHYEIVAQRGGGLEERLSNGFADLGPGVIIGMETPQVAHELADAVGAISSGHDVIGMAIDGGYWMIGLAATDAATLRAVFDGVAMSRSDTGSQQLARLEAQPRPVTLLSTARDLDDYADLRAVAESGGSGRLPTLARAVVARYG